jgi:hypothetical protein
VLKLRKRRGRAICRILSADQREYSALEDITIATIIEDGIRNPECADGDHGDYYTFHVKLPVFLVESGGKCPILS